MTHHITNIFALLISFLFGLYIVWVMKKGRQNLLRLDIEDQRDGRRYKRRKRSRINSRKDTIYH